MAVIFSFSSDTQSGQHSSRIIGPILHWFFPNLAPKQVEEVVYFARKCAHETEYAAFAVLLWRARNKPSRKNRVVWRWSEARFVVLLAMAYAATDEFHQAFVPSRESSVVDVMIDSCGASLGLLALWGIDRWRKVW